MAEEGRIGSEDEGSRQTPFELIGGKDGVRRLVDRFYDLMDADPTVHGIRAMHPPALPGALREFLRERFHGVADHMRNRMQGPAPGGSAPE